MEIAVPVASVTCQPAGTPAEALPSGAVKGWSCIELAGGFDWAAAETKVQIPMTAKITDRAAI
jgi:hypothetical protein